MRESRAGFLAKNNFGSGFVGEFAMAADKIGMQMSFDDVLDSQILRVGFFDVLIDIALRIDNGCFTIRSDQIRSVRETTEIELLEVHELSQPAGILWLNLDQPSG